MEKRIFLAILISIGFLWLWAAVAPKLFPDLAKKEPAATATQTAGAPKSGTTPAATATTPASAATPAMAAAVPAAPVAATSVQNTVVDAKEYTAVFTNRGAQLVSFRLKDYNRKGSDAKIDLVKAREAGRNDYPFSISTRDAALSKQLNEALYSVTERSEKGARVIEFRYSNGQTSVVKTFRFGNQPFLFDYAVQLSPSVPYRLQVGPGIRTLTPEELQSKVIITGNGIVNIEDDFEVVPREKASNVEVYPGVEYIGIEDNYFMTVLRPTRGGEGVLQKVAFFDDKKVRRDDLYAAVNSAADGTVAGDAFFGPKETKILDAYGMGEALQFGWFGLIARFFLRALVWINQYTLNWGFAIIVLTILIKIVLYPLQHKSIVSMKKMQKVQPKVEAIKAKYKKSKTDPDQRQKMNVEMMALYQKEGINPMAGCLPLVLQLPILWGFYNLLSRAIELRGADFMLWINDLSEKDPTYVLPILMTATMFIQTYITPSTGDPAQRKIFLIMPLVFGFMFKDFPSGLVLYWLVQNVLTIVQQLIMNKWWKEHPQEVMAA
jgi:YidC/Oxa1 family membrane protein insertase